MDYSIKIEKFNKILLTKYYVRKLNPQEQTIRGLLAYYLSLGCEKYPKEEDFSFFLQNNYDISYEVLPYNVGSYNILKFTLHCVNPKYIDDSNYTFSFLKSAFNECMKPVIKNNSFDRRLFNKAKEMYYSDILYALEDFDTIANHNALNTYFKGTINDYERIGNINELSCITPKMLYNYYLSIINDNNVSYIAGDIPNDLANDNINDIQTLDKHYFYERGKNNTIVIDNKNTNQAYLRIIYDGNIFSNDKLFFPAVFISYHLGGSSNSLLFSIIREKYGLCYSISSSYYASSGILIITATINKNDVDKVIKAIDEVYQNLIDTFDLEFIKKYFIYNKYEENDNISTYISNRFYDDHFPYLIKSTEEIEYINKVTMEDIIEAHKKLKRKLVYVYGGDSDE